ncbi:MAG: hypothetical protein K2Y37_25910 [Pirellulales bacterium]|nr:hypothetical protein [Pirellulales bacterium]
MRIELRLLVSVTIAICGDAQIAVAQVPQSDKPPAVADTTFVQEYRDPFLVGRTPEESDVRAVAVDAQHEMLLATRAGVRRVEQGKLVKVDAALDGPAYDVCVVPASANSNEKSADAFAATWRGLFQRLDGQWRKIDDVTGPIAAIDASADRVVAGGPDGYWQRIDGRWSKFADQCSTDVQRLLVNGANTWIGTQTGLFQVTPTAITRMAEDEWIDGANIQALARGEDGRIWVGTDVGLAIYDNGRPVTDRFAAAAAIPGNDVRALALDKRGRVWAGTSLGAARVAVDAAPGTYWALRHSLRWLPSNEVRDVCCVDDVTYVATSAGLAILRERTMTLAEKAAHYEEIVRARHVRPPGLMEKCYLRTPGDLTTWAPWDTDNDGGFTAVYLGSQSYRYAATRDPAAKEMADRLFDGLEFLQTVTGTKGFVARTVVPADWKRMSDPNRTYTDEEVAEERVRDPRFRRMENRWRLSRDGRWRWKGDTSSDEITTHFFGYALYYDLAADEPRRQRVRALVRRVMDYIIDGGFVLRDIDGQATAWGVWSPEKLNGDPNWQPERGTNSVEILSYLVTTAHITGDKTYLDHANELCTRHGYNRLVRHPKLAVAGQFTFIDDELLACAYRGLFAYGSKLACRESLRAGLDQWFLSAQHVDSPLYTFVWQLATGRETPRGQEACIEFLRRAPLDLVMWAVDNTARRDARIVPRPVADRAQTDRLLPPDERGVVGWDGNGYQANEHGFGGHAEASPVFWLTPYWMGRHAGFIEGAK